MHACVARVLLPLVASFAALSPAFAAAAPEPTAFERFATEPNIVVAASREVGSLASLDSTVAVTVLVATSPADEAQRMRGVRFDLRNNGGTERIYLDDRELAKLRTEVALMERFNAAAMGRTGSVTSGMNIHGTESCWMPNPVRRILCPEIQTAPAWSGLRLWTFGGARFDFRDRTVTELRELVERALTELDEL